MTNQNWPLKQSGFQGGPHQDLRRSGAQGSVVKWGRKVGVGIATTFATDLSPEMQSAKNVAAGEVTASLSG